MHSIAVVAIEYQWLSLAAFIVEGVGSQHRDFAVLSRNRKRQAVQVRTEPYACLYKFFQAGLRELSEGVQTRVVFDDDDGATDGVLGLRLEMPANSKQLVLFFVAHIETCGAASPLNNQPFRHLLVRRHESLQLEAFARWMLLVVVQANAKYGFAQLVRKLSRKTAVKSVVAAEHAVQILVACDETGIHY